MPQGGGGGKSLPPLNFSFQIFTVEMKLRMLLDILTKNLSVLKIGKIRHFC